MYRPLTVTPSGGGQLVTRLSPEKGQEAGYTVKTNWRRDLEDEVRREGWKDFDPKTAANSFPGGGNVSLIHLVRNPDGRIAMVVAEADKLWRYAGLTDGSYWESGYAVGDGVDGSEYVQSVLDDWEIIGSGFQYVGDGNGNAHRWEAENVNGYTVFNNGYDLPVVYRADWYLVKPLYELREQGVVKVDTIAEFNGFLVCGDISELKTDKLTTILSGSDPYGPVSDTNLFNRVRYRLIWSGLGDPTVWGMVVTGSTSGFTFATDYPIESLYLGREFLVVGAGENGGNYSVRVLAFNESGGKTIISFDIRAPVDTDCFIQDNTSAAQIVGSYDLQDDGSKVLRLLELRGDRLIVYKDTSIFLGAYTGSVDAPFEFRRTYKGEKSLHYRWSLIELNNVHLYAGAESFYSFDLTNRDPLEIEAFEVCSNLFFDNVDISKVDSVFAGVNQLTKEAWFNVPGLGVLAYYYLRPSVSVIDVKFSAFKLIDKPQLNIPGEATESWWVMGGAGKVLLYGLNESEAAYYTREGAEFDSILESSLLDLDDPFNEKILRSYIPVVASTNDSLTITLYFQDNVNAPPVLIGTRAVGAGADWLVPVHAIGLYFKDRIVATGPNNIRLSNRTFEFDVVGTRSTPRHNRT